MAEQNRTEVSSYYSESNDKKAVVCLLDGRYIIDFYEQTEYSKPELEYTHSILFAYENHSLNYVEDAAENFVLGHFKNFKDFR
jgi:hypothetical protein